MNSSLDISAVKEPPRTLVPAPARRRDLVLWILIGVFIIGQGIWAACVGLSIRSDLWPNTRSTRFQADLVTLFFLGNGALRAEEARDHLQPIQRKLTFSETCDAIVHYYDYCLTSGEDLFGNPYSGLDYPPLRLTVATFFVRHVQETHPEYRNFPARRGRPDTVVPQDEDIAYPLLNFNTVCEALAAVGMFGLVWLWVRRGAGKTLLDPPPRYPRGLAAFLVATAAFWYCYAGLSALPPRATPTVNLLSVVPSGYTASIYGVVDGQQSISRWRIEWGTSPAYSHATPFRPIPGFRPIRVLVTISPVTQGQTIHFRLVANAISGTSATPDQTFVAGGPSVTFSTDPVGGSSWPDWPAWMAMFVLFIVMVASARILPPVHRAWACAWIAALMVWFDPMVIIDGHVWPQWDVWILPIFIFAALLASVNWWLCAGLVLALGCMMKGQILLAGPILFLWPIFEGKWGAAGRILTGFALGTALLLWPWLINSGDAHHWIILFVIALILYGDGLVMLRKIRPVRAAHPLRFYILIAVVACAGLFCIFWSTRLPGHRLWAAAATTVLIGMPWIFAGRSIKYWTLATAAAGVWAAGATLGGDFAWWQLGFAYGTVKHDQMQMGLGSFTNFPSLLLQRYKWDLHDPVGTLSILHWNFDLDLKTSLAIAYGATLLLMSFAAAMQSRRKDPRILIALCAPWLLFPIIMCQTGDRYMLWPSALSAAFVAVSTGFSLLHVLLAILAAGEIGHQLLNGDHGRWPGVFQFFNQAYPEAAFLMILLAAIVFFAALIPGKSKE